MRAAVAHGALLTDLADCLADTTPQLWALARMQLSLGDCWALRDAGGCLACGGYARLDADTGEAWFAALPRAAPAMLTIVRLARLTASQQPYGRIRTWVTTAAGGRIARLAGYRYAETINGIEVWQWDF